MSDKPIHVLLTQPFPEPLIERMRSISPRLQFHLHPGREASELPANLLQQIEILYTSRILPPSEEVPKLRWIQLHSAGIDHIVDEELARRDLIITNLSGASVPQMAEYALGLMLALGHHLPEVLADQSQKHWTEDRFRRFRPLELRAATVGIVGYGSIGRELARLCHALGARVLAVKRDLKHLEDRGYIPEGLGDPGAELPRRIYPPQALASMASECDYLVVTTPLTPQTRGLVGDKVFQQLPAHAYLIDVSRGGVVDHGALVTALQDKKLAGAALDVYPIEPLPDTSPLWGFPNVILSPHIAGASEHYFERAATLFSENLRRYIHGEPLLNRFNPEQGY